MATETTTAEDKRKHLEFIQGVINRLSSNSFLFKGWSITVIGGLFLAFITTNNYSLLWLILALLIIFWAIDAYYLMLERCYRDLYQKVAETVPEKINYEMKVLNSGIGAWLATITRPVLLMFYGIAVVAVLVLIYVLK